MRKWQRDLAATIKRDTEDFRTVIKHLPGMQQCMKINILEYIQAHCTCLCFQVSTMI